MAFNRAMLRDVFGLPEVGGTVSVLRRDTDTPESWWDLDRDSDLLTMDTRIAHAYNEDAFRYFLEIERRRADVSGRPFLLLLIDLDTGSLARTPIEPETADQLFEALASCLRDTDFVGWYREGRIAGGVLTQDSATAAASMLDCVSARVRTALATTLPAETLGHAQVRVYQVPGSARNRI